MKLPTVCWCLAFLLLLVVSVNSAPAKNDDDLSPLNENDEDERADRDKRKIGVIKLGVSNGILNFVFGKLDAFLDAKTQALGVLDESNRAKNAAYEIDSSKSATSEFISKFLQQKVRATSGSVGPLLNAGTTFLSTAGQGLAGAFVSKLAPLSSLSGGLAGGLSGGSSGGNNNGDDDGNAQGPGLSAGGGSNSGSFLTGLIGSLAGSSSGGGGGGLGGLSGGLSGGSNQDSSTDNGIGVDFDGDFPSAAGPDAPGNAGFANLGNANAGRKIKIRATTEEDIPEFDRTKVSLDIPKELFGEGFTLVTDLSKVLGSLITNSAKRTERIMEVFKPLFRGIFAIKGLPSDNEIK